MPSQQSSNGTHEDAQRAEAEARSYMKDGLLGPGSYDTEELYAMLDGYAEAVRRTEARKAAEMLSILEIIEHHDYLMEHEFSSGLRARIRSVIKEARNG